MGAFADALVNSGMRQAQALVIERGMGGVPPIPGTLEFKEALIRVGVDHHSATLLSNGLLAAAVPGDGIAVARNVCDRGILCNTLDNTKNYVNGVRAHNVFWPLWRIRVSFPNVAVQGGNPSIAPAASSQVTAAIEYPAGVFSMLTFSGATQGTIPSGAWLESDWLQISLPAGAKIKINWWMYNAAGLVYAGTGSNSQIGDRCEVSATALPDKTMTGAAPFATGYVYCGPLVVIGEHAGPAAMLLGDSLVFGQADNANGMGHAGLLERNFGPGIPCGKYGVAGSKMQDWAATFGHLYETRVLTYLLQYHTKAILALGTNDFVAGRTSANVVTDLASVVSKLPGQEIYVCNVGPRTDASNTTPATGDAERLTYNGALLSGVSGVTGVFDIASAVTATPNASLWAAAALTADGVHHTPLGYSYVQARAGMSVAALRKDTALR